MEKRPALGKGLSALIPDAPALAAPSRTPTELDVDELEPSQFQPRLHLDEARLDGLAASIRANGVVQPVVVRRVGARYQIIAGERRWRAAQRAGLTRVPVVVKDVPAGNDVQLLEWALIENLQREDLNPIEEATAYQRLASEFHLTHEEIASRVGKDRSTVANTLRLLKLAPEVRAEVTSNALSMGHARALVALPDEAEQRRIAREVVARGLSVRETEALVKRALEPSRAASSPARPPAKDADTRAAEQTLYRALGAPVEIVRRGKGGSVVIAFASEAELQRLYDLLTDQRVGPQE